jgi:hypothetical protein
MFVENFVHFSQSYDIKALLLVSGPFTDASLLYNLISTNYLIRQPDSIFAPPNSHRQTHYRSNSVFFPAVVRKYSLNSDVLQNIGKQGGLIIEK